MTRKSFLQAGAATARHRHARASRLRRRRRAGEKARAQEGRQPRHVQRRRRVRADRFKMIQDAGFDGVELNRPDAIPLDEHHQSARRHRARQSPASSAPRIGASRSVARIPTVREQGFNGLKLALQEVRRTRLRPAAARARRREQGRLLRRRLHALAGDHQQAVPFRGESESAASRSRTSGTNSSSARSRPRASSMRSAARGSAGISTSATSSPTAGRSSGSASSGKRVLNLHIKEFSRKKRDAEGLRERLRRRTRRRRRRTGPRS